jgi:hypothetical protein
VHQIPLRRYFDEKKAGTGPDEMQLGGSVRISVEASAKWRADRTEETRLAGKAANDDAPPADKRSA